MDVVTTTEFRKNMAKILNKVNNDHAPVAITRRGGKPVVLMSLEDYNSHMETLHLMSSPRNAARLAESIAQAEAGLTVEHDLIED